MCVPGASVSKAASMLEGTGLFELEAIVEFDIYTEHKRDCTGFLLFMDVTIFQSCASS